MTHRTDLLQVAGWEELSCKFRIITVVRQYCGEAATIQSGPLSSNPFG